MNACKRGVRDIFDRGEDGGANQGDTSLAGDGVADARMAMVWCAMFAQSDYLIIFAWGVLLARTPSGIVCRAAVNGGNGCDFADN